MVRALAQDYVLYREFITLDHPNWFRQEDALRLTALCLASTLLAIGVEPLLTNFGNVEKVPGFELAVPHFACASLVEE